MKFHACIKCGAELPLTGDFFYRKVQTKLGFDSTCKACRAERRNENATNEARVFFGRRGAPPPIPEEPEWMTAKDIAELLRNTRREADLTQSGAGALVGMTGQHLGQWETARGLDSVERVFRLMHEFGYELKLSKTRSIDNATRRAV